MSYITQAVSVYGTEIDFIESFINEMTKASGGRIKYDTELSGSTTISGLFNDSDEPTIYIDVDGLYKIKFKRYIAQATTRTSTKYLISTIINNIESDISHLYFSSIAYKLDAVASRASSFSLAINEYSVYLCIGNKNDVLPTNKMISILSIKDGNLELVASDMSTNSNSNAKGTALATNSDFVSVKDGSIFSCSAMNRISYIRGEKTEVIKNKSFVSSESFVCSSEALYDCSTVSQDSIVVCNSANYYAIDSHTLIQI